MIVVVISAVLSSLVGAAAGAATSPTMLVLPQGDAFAVLGHSCGGISEQVYATGFDASSGYPDGDAHLSTTCSTGGRGSRPATFTAWASATWDFTGAVVTYARLAIAPTGLNPTLSAYDSYGNELYNSSGHAYLALAAGFVPSPRLTGLTVATGPAAGGTALTISGTGFTQATAVEFGTIGAAQFSIQNDTTITAITPPAADGTVDVTVTSPGGTSVTSTADRFTFVAAPTVTGLTPAVGSVSGGTSVTITGTHLSHVTSVAFGDQPAGFVIDNDTTITATAPPAEAADTASVTVTSIGGTSTTSAAATYTYVFVPAISITPAAGLPGTTVMVSGTEFSTTETVRITYATGKALPATTTICTAIVSAGGSFACQGKIPSALTAGSRGNHTITATGATGDKAQTGYTLT